MEGMLRAAFYTLGELLLLPFLPMPQNSTFASKAAPIVGIQAA
jgi:hypothetical protein